MAQSVYQIYSVFPNFAIAVCFANFCFLEISIPVIPTMLTMMNVVQMIVSDFCTLRISDLQCFPTFWNCTFLAHFDLFEISPPVMCIMVTLEKIAHSVYKVYSVFKLFQIAVCIAHWFTVFSNFSDLQFVLDILAFSKFLLRRCASC